jgi:hypothetical protein
VAALLMKPSLGRILSVMKWIIGFLLTVAIFLSSYAVFKTTRLESATKPQVHLIASAAAAR